MTSLADAKPGTYEIKWIFTDRTIKNYFDSFQMNEGSTIQIISQFKNYVLFAYNSHRFVLENDIASQIKL